MVSGYRQHFFFGCFHGAEHNTCLLDWYGHGESYKQTGFNEEWHGGDYRASRSDDHVRHCFLQSHDGSGRANQSM